MVDTYAEDVILFIHGIIRRQDIKKEETEYKFTHTFGRELGKELFLNYSTCRTQKKRHQFYDELIEKYPIEAAKYFGFL